MKKSNVRIVRSAANDMEIEVKRWIGEGKQFIDIKFINSNQVVCQRFSLSEFALLRTRVNEFVNS